MKNQVFNIFAALSILISCNSNKSTQNQSSQGDDSVVLSPTTTDEIVIDTIINASGQALYLKHNNTQGILTATLNGETIEMKRDTTASGVAASNDHYKYTEWQGEVKLEKDGKTIFESKGDEVSNTAKDKDGIEMNMVFNNTRHTAIVILKGDTIKLLDQKPASGIWYRNDHYELRGKGSNVELTRDGKTIFKSK